MHSIVLRFHHFVSLMRNLIISCLNIAQFAERTDYRQRGTISIELTAIFIHLKLTLLATTREEG